MNVPVLNLEAQKPSRSKVRRGGWGAVADQEIKRRKALRDASRVAGAQP